MKSHQRWKQTSTRTSSHAPGEAAAWAMTGGTEWGPARHCDAVHAAASLQHDARLVIDRSLLVVAGAKTNAVGRRERRASEASVARGMQCSSECSVESERVQRAAEQAYLCLRRAGPASVAASDEQPVRPRSWGLAQNRIGQDASLGGAGRNEPQKSATRFRAECLTKLHSQAGHFTRQGVACENARVALFPAQCGRLHALGDFLRLELPGLILLKECAPSE
jgi:hypothetical protein